MKPKRNLFVFLLLVCFMSSALFVPQAQASGENWLWGWDYRRAITITGAAGAGTNYQVPITVIGNITATQEDYDDIRFTEADGITQLDYWLEDYGINYDPAYFWVKVTANLDTDQTIYMYYGNSDVSTTSDGAATFIVYEDWDSESVRGTVWDTQDIDGGVTYAGGAKHGKIAKVDGDAGATYQITTDYDTPAPTAVIFRANIEDADAGNSQRMGSGWAGAFSFALIESDAVGNDFRCYDDDGNQDAQPMAAGYFDTWWTFQITRDGTNAKLYADTNLIETASIDPDIITNPAFSILNSDSENDIYSDWVAVRKFKAGTEPTADPTFGAEENEPLRSWQAIGDDARFIFVVGWHPVATFGYDAFFVFMGLIMIPFSTMYLVKGGRKELSSDKVFYFLVLFMLGWGFFIGGIMP